MATYRGQKPPYWGAGTFNQIPLVLDEADLSGIDVAIVGAPMDDMVTYRPGTRFGPRAIRAANDMTTELWHVDLGVDPFAPLRVVDFGDAPVSPGDAHASHAAIRESVARILAAGAVPVVLGGDHSIAYPTISAMAEAHGKKEIAVVQFDTHADTATENWGVQWAHGTPFRNLVDNGILPGTSLVQVGLRGYWPFAPEWDWMRRAGLRWHRMDEVQEMGIDAIVDTVLDEIREASHLYLSVDIDVLDPAYAPGTGTPEPGGMTSYQLLRAVRRLVLARGLAGMEIVEVSPPYDHAEITAIAANRVVLEALSALAVHRSGSGPRPEDS
jgi:agmatinase